ncbi:MAG: UDP-N-acetylmuramoyl-L-alanine--D-glutamate ligase, partial [Candidatus Omnitrophica bacterium]|nr:UDP-N-acetylmuramoyl-L-alanine--D-glutamate ligase [Candidatus Omnitrophota bacterium]
LRQLDQRKIKQIEIGEHSEQLISGQDLVVVSPGVPLDAAPIKWARKKSIPVIGEVELAFRFCPASTVAITGTNGKTTVTTLVGEIFKQAKRKYVVCGNIGNPFSAELKQISSEHTVILEISSFQLETIDKFRPKVAVILNLSDDHLDRYLSFNEYAEAKCRIFLNQTKQDWAILNDEDPNCLALAARTQAKVAYFSKVQDLPAHKFNANHFAALTVSSLFDIQQDLALSVLHNFKGLEHRLETLREIRGVEFINDSKATNVDSTLWALEAIRKPIVLIAGGRDKGSNFSAFRQKIGERVQAMVVLGEAKEKLKAAFSDLVTIKEAKSMLEAVEIAARLAHCGSCVLLSPMCASFDMFTDYQHRGRVFKQAVAELD